MKKETIFFLSIISIIFLLGCQSAVQQETICPTCEQCQQSQIPVGKAILDVNVYTNALNIDNHSEYFFDYLLLNYGDAESKDVKVRCKLLKDSGEAVIDVIDDFSNIASNSDKLGEVSADYKGNIEPDGLYAPVCYVESCTNCDILYKRIPDLMQGYTSQ